MQWRVLSGGDTRKTLQQVSPTFYPPHLHHHQGVGQDQDHGQSHHSSPPWRRREGWESHLHPNSLILCEYSICYCTDNILLLNIGSFSDTFNSNNICDVMSVTVCWWYFPWYFRWLWYLTHYLSHAMFGDKKWWHHTIVNCVMVIYFYGGFFVWLLCMIVYYFCL